MLGSVFRRTEVCTEKFKTLATMQPRVLQISRRPSVTNLCRDKRKEASMGDGIGSNKRVDGGRDGGGDILRSYLCLALSPLL